MISLSLGASSARLTLMFSNWRSELIFLFVHLTLYLSFSSSFGPTNIMKGILFFSEYWRKCCTLVRNFIRYSVWIPATLSSLHSLIPSLMSTFPTTATRTSVVEDLKLFTSIFVQIYEKIRSHPRLNPMQSTSTPESDLIRVSYLPPPAIDPSDFAIYEKKVKFVETESMARLARKLVRAVCRKAYKNSDNTYYFWNLYQGL